MLKLNTILLTLLCVSRAMATSDFPDIEKLIHSGHFDEAMQQIGKINDRHELRQLALKSISQWNVERDYGQHVSHFVNLTRCSIPQNEFDNLHRELQIEWCKTPFRKSAIKQLLKQALEKKYDDDSNPTADASADQFLNGLDIIKKIKDKRKIVIGSLAALAIGWWFRSSTANSSKQKQTELPKDDPAQAAPLNGQNARRRGPLLLQYRNSADEMPPEMEVRDAYAMLQASQRESNYEIHSALIRQQTRLHALQNAAIQNNDNQAEFKRLGDLVVQTSNAEEVILRHRRLQAELPAWRRSHGFSLQDAPPIQEEEKADNNGALTMQTAYQLLGVRIEDDMTQAQIQKHHLIARHALELIRASENNDENESRRLQTVIQRTQRAYELITSREQLARQASDNIEAAQARRASLQGQSIHEYKNAAE